MRFFIQLVFALAIAYFLGPHLPYWILMVLVAGTGAIFRGNTFLSFAAGALGVGLVWLLVPLMIWSASGSALPGKMAGIMGLGNGALLLGITGFLGFLIGGSSALTGNLLGKLLEGNRLY
ncbi:hypothetical protein [Negadavirga shengliensis]|uniref:Uncharacterized protein n=1 Tax=Negadavirga shengliensis TaxID=1389218 RepID=A0ABV9T890_9BACT